MDDKKLEKWLGSVDSRHRAVLVVSKRAKQIQKGLRPYFDSKTSKVTTMALEEFVKGKVDWYELSQEEVDALGKDTHTVKESVRIERPEKLEKREIKMFDDFTDVDSDTEPELDEILPDADDTND